MKKILTILVGLLIFVAVVAIYMFDTIGKKYAQEYAQNLLKTPVAISQFSSSLFDKSLNIDFIEVQNPSNFRNKNALSLDHLSVKVGEFSDDLIVIDALTFEGLTFALEQNNTKVNLTQLFANLEKESEVTAVSSNNSGNQRIKIKQFKVNNINLKIDTQWLKTTLKVPNISVSNFGGESGAKLDDIGKQIAKEVFQTLKRALEKEGIEAGKKKIKETLTRKIKQKLGIDGISEKFNLDNIKDSIGSGYKDIKDKAKEQFQEKIQDITKEKLKDKTKDLLKGFGF